MMEHKTDLQERIAELEAQVDRLAGENAFLMGRIDWPKEQCPATGKVTDLAPADFIPATAAFIEQLRNEARAEGVGMFASFCREKAEVRAYNFFSDAALNAEEFAAQLRNAAPVEPQAAAEKRIADGVNVLKACAPLMLAATELQDPKSGALAGRVKQPDADGWIEWNGGEVQPEEKIPFQEWHKMNAANMRECERMGITYPPADSDGWIEWNGGEWNDGECPAGINDDTSVQVRMRNGGETVDDKASAFGWSHTGDSGDIIAYRVCKGEVQ